MRDSVSRKQFLPIAAGGFRTSDVDYLRLLDEACSHETLSRHGGAEAAVSITGSAGVPDLLIGFQDLNLAHIKPHQQTQTRNPEAPNPDS